jgi:hypothetical protein
MTTSDSPPAALPPRRRFQFSLRMMFLITALWAVLLGLWSLNRDVSRCRNAENYNHAEYNAGTVVIFCYRGTLVGQEVIANALATAGRGRPIDAIEIKFLEDGEMFPGKLDTDALEYINQLNLKSFSLMNVDDNDIPRLERLSSVQSLHIWGVVSPSALARLRRSLPSCRVALNRSGG